MLSGEARLLGRLMLVVTRLLSMEIIDDGANGNRHVFHVGMHEQLGAIELAVKIGEIRVHKLHRLPIR